MPKRVLVVEDDAAIRELVTFLLTDGGYEVRTAADGSAALRAVAQEQPDVILLDMRMPVMNGREFAKAYRQRYNGMAKPVLCMSADVDIHQAAKAIKAEGCLPKPFDVDQLLSLVAFHAGAAA